MLTPAEAATKTSAEIVIRDERADRSTPLLAVLENDGTVAARTVFTKPLYLARGQPLTRACFSLA